MKPAHRPLAFIAVAFAAVMAVLVIMRVTTPRELIPWRSDFAAAQAEAQASGKPLLVYFTADWCPPCHELKGTTWADGDVEKALRSYVPARVDVMVEADVAKRYDVQFLPTYVVLDAGGQVVSTANGYLDAEGFLSWLNGK